MISPRAVGAAFVAYPVTVVALAASAPPALLFVGLLPGVVAGALAPAGGRQGALHGGLAGVAITLGTWLALWTWVTVAPPERIAPGFGLSLALLAALALAAGVQSLVAGAVVGLVR